MRVRLGQMSRDLSPEELENLRPAVERLRLRFSSDTAMADALEISQTQISRFRRHQGGLGRGVAERVAEKLGVPVSDMLAGHRVRTVPERLDAIEERQGQLFALLTEVLERLDALAPDGDGDGMPVGIGGLEVEQPALAGSGEGEEDAEHHRQMPPRRRLHAKSVRTNRARKAKS